MDIQMPEMDGYEATKRIRKLSNKTSSKVPIIALTASVFDSEKEEALNAGMNDHICKPFTPKQLYDKIVSYV
ncbi:MAG: response regulator, partial [Lachnospiraceae bacterium]|nr:response regulator [Lachnospiraceae bacterium]